MYQQEYPCSGTVWNLRFAMIAVFFVTFTAATPPGQEANAKSPHLPATVSWIGNTYPGQEKWVPQDIDALCVAPDGTLLSNVHWEEGGGNVTAFKDGEVLGTAGHTHGWGNQGGYAVAANAKYVFIAGRMNNEGGGLKDPDTWPPKGFDWIGISRRHLSDIRSAAPFPCGKGGKGDTLKETFLVVDQVPVDTKALDDLRRRLARLACRTFANVCERTAARRANTWCFWKRTAKPRSCSIAGGRDF